MFGAPPVGHVMDPQFKPLFLGVMEICMQMQVCSINPVGGLAKGYIPHMYVRTTMSFGGAIVFPLLVPLWSMGNSPHM